jgi:hypothetical protein
MGGWHLGKVRLESRPGTGPRPPVPRRIFRPVSRVGLVKRHGRDLFTLAIRWQVR